MSLPNWILENIVAVEDEYLTPKPRLQAIGQTTALIILPKVREKWSSFVDRHRLIEKKLPVELENYIQRLQPEQLENVNRHSFSVVLGVKPTARIELGSVNVEWHTQIWFIFADNELVEFVTFRGLRTLKARAAHEAKSQPSGMPDALRIHKISKYPRQLKIQGGLIKQERQPRDRWKGTKRTY
jgi:hypothetical protein